MLYHILHALVNFTLVEDRPEDIENTIKGPRTDLAEPLPTLLHKIHSDLDAVVGRLVEQEGEDLEGNHHTTDVLVYEVGDENCC